MALRLAHIVAAKTLRKATNSHITKRWRQSDGKRAITTILKRNLNGITPNVAAITHFQHVENLPTDARFAVICGR